MMKKRLLSMLLAIVMVVGLMPGFAVTASALTEGADYTITNGKLVIHDGVTTIDNYAFYNNQSITSVEIPDSVTEIGNYAFYYCSKLTAVTIAGNSSLTIGNYAFNGCSSLSSVTYQSKNAPVSIGFNAFPTTVKSVTVPYGFTENSFGGLSLNIVGGGPVAVASVTLKRNGNDAGSRVSMTCNAPMQLTADISPANADNQKVTWTQAEQNGAKPFLTIVNDGTITADFAGYTAADFEPFVYGYYSDVTVTTEDGSKTDTVTVEVNRYTLVIKNGETEKFRLPRPAGYALSGLIPAEYTTPSKPGYIFKGWKRAYEKADGTMGYDRLITSLPATMPHTSASNAAHEQIYVEQWEVDPDATFAVTVSNTTGGTVTASHTTAAAETVITLTVDVSNGYELEGFTDGTNTLATDKVNDQSYTFVMPNQDVNVTPVYKSLHQHQWTYTAAGAAITATCQNTDGACTAPNGGSVSIAAPDSTAYTGNAIEAKVDDSLTTGASVAVVYAPADKLTDGKPVNPGTYTATITLDSVFISVTYTITNVLNGVAVTADPASPVAVPTKGDTEPITLTAKADYAYGPDEDVTAAAAWSLDGSYTGVSILNNVITVTPDAAAGSIKATAAYGGKSGETTITLIKTGAGELAALHEISGPDTIGLSGKTEPQTGIYTITGEDAYGAAVTPSVQWSVTGYDGVTMDANGQLTVPTDVPNGTVLTITATSGSLSKTKDVTVTAHVHEWTYTAAGATITATCQNTDGGCPNTDGGSVTLAVPDSVVYTGSVIEAKMTNTLTTGASVAVVYAPVDKLTDGEPVQIGSYTASVTIDGQTAGIAYDIVASITLYPGEGTCDAASVLTDANGKLTALPDAMPTDAEMQFVGWYTAEQEGEAVTTDTVFTENGKIYARYVQKTYTVTIVGGGANATGAGEYAKDATVILSAGRKENYTFAGWTTEDGIVFADAASVVTTFSMPNKPVTVTAAWQPVTAPGGGGSGNRPDSGNYPPVCFPLPNPTAPMLGAGTTNRPTDDPNPNTGASAFSIAPIAFVMLAGAAAWIGKKK